MSGRKWADPVPLERVSADPDPQPRGTSAPAFLAVYHRYFDFVWSSAKYLGVGPDAIDDVVQEVFMVVHARLHTLQHPEALRSWVYGIVRRTVSTHRRSNRAKAGVGVWELAGATGPGPATPLELAERTAQVELLASLLAELDDAKREVFVAAELEEMTVPEIAEALEIPLNTAYSRLRAARQVFEERLARRTVREKGERGT
jgi:RNA polymerase sigma-70 factor (ECF subfamily)